MVSFRAYAQRIAQHDVSRWSVEAMLEAISLLILAVVGFSLLILVPAQFLGSKGKSRYTFALIIALAIPFASFAYAMDGYSGIGFVALVASLFLIANIPN
jgi:lysylphosphatidylglycerol synthetase-like protein (DUF2156 family)